MRILADKSIRGLFQSLFIVLITFTVLIQGGCFLITGRHSLPLAAASLCLSAAVLLLCFGFFKRRDSLIESAVEQTKRFLSGERDARIECSEEGELYCLFQSVNTLAAVLDAQAEREKQRNEFMKRTVSDISHQLKTPLAALNIYNGLIGETESLEDVRRFSAASESELDRMENLVKNLLKLTRLDAGAITLDRHPEDLADMMAELKRRFSLRTEAEGKEILLEGGDDILDCDGSWLSEALGNLIKNALDHTGTGGLITVSWKRQGGMETISVSDNGCGIHPDDIHHIFKRFYRSRFSKDTQGIGLGLPLAKAIVEAHGGSIEVSSEWGKGAVFVLTFLIPTKL